MDRDEETAKLILEMHANGEPVKPESVFWAEEFFTWKTRREAQKQKQEEIFAIWAEQDKLEMEEYNKEFNEMMDELVDKFKALEEKLPEDHELRTTIQGGIDSIIRAKIMCDDPNFKSPENMRDHFKQAQYQAAIVAGVKIDQDYENINYRFNPIVYTPDNKLKYIQEFERCGLLMHKNNGGEFLPGDHAEIYSVLNECLAKHKTVNDINLKFSDHDYRAFEVWDKMVREQQKELGLNDIEMFLIKVMNAAKIGSVADTKIRAIATSDTEPCKRFRPWISDNYVIAPVRGLKFKETDQKLFLPIYQTASEIQAEKTLRRDIENELGREVKFI